MQGPRFGDSQARTALLQEAKNLFPGHSPGLQLSKQAGSKLSGAYTKCSFPGSTLSNSNSVYLGEGRNLHPRVIVMQVVEQLRPSSNEKTEVEPRLWGLHHPTQGWGQGPACPTAARGWF